MFVKSVSPAAARTDRVNVFVTFYNHFSKFRLRFAFQLRFNREKIALWWITWRKSPTEQVSVLECSIARCTMFLPLLSFKVKSLTSLRYFATSVDPRITDSIRAEFPSLHCTSTGLPWITDQMTVWKLLFLHFCATGVFSYLFRQTQIQQIKKINCILFWRFAYVQVHVQSFDKILKQFIVSNS